MLIFGSSENRFLSRIQDGLKPLLHLVASNVRVRFVGIAQEEDERVVERRLCLVLLRNDNEGLFLSSEERNPRWYLSYANVDGVWLFRLGDCEDQILILQTFPRSEIQKAAVELVEDLYRKREESLRYLAEVIESLRGSLEEGVGQEEAEVSVLIA